MTNPIGGYFSLELPMHEELHKNAIALNTGRNCLEYILRARQYKKVYIPYYTCEVILEPFQKTYTEYVFYHINIHFEIVDDICLKENEALLYTNYFGLKQEYVKILASKYGKQLIVDNTQAFYTLPIPGIDTFYTCRKFFGVPDGAYLYTEKLLDIDLEHDISWNRLAFLAKRIDLGAEAGYSDFQEESKSLSGQPIKKMSKLTKRMMCSVDYRSAAQVRKANFCILHDGLASKNLLDLSLESGQVPMIYPFMINIPVMRDNLINEKVFIARYWPNVLKWVQETDIEYSLVTLLVAIPIDQRCRQKDMKFILDIINNGNFDK